MSIKRYQNQQTVAFSCGCDDPKPVIDKYQSAGVVVSASNCKSCGRIISFQIHSDMDIHHVETITANEVLGHD